MRSIKNILFLILYFPLGIEAASDDPCRGSTMMVNLINRPSISDSACTVPTGKLLIEGGSQYQNLIGMGNQRNYPNLSLRLGLSNDTEVLFLPPNQIQQSVVPYSGYTASWASIKSRFYYNKDWVVSGELYISPPSGSSTFGSPKTEAIADAMIFKNLSKNLSLELQMGVSSLCASQISGGQCVQSINPDLLVGYNFTQKFNGYLEIAAQTKTSYLNGSGAIAGGGFIYLYRPTITLDIEFYHRIYGELGNIEDFFGIGLSKLIK